MKKNPVVVFGTAPLSSLAQYCLNHDSQYQVVAHTVDRAYLKDDAHEGLPVHPFEDLETHCPPGEVSLLIPLGYHAINGLRRDRYLAAKARGYTFASYISSRASTWPDLQVGENCMIYEHAIIQPFARIGNNVIIRSCAHISHHCHIADHVFIAAGVTTGGCVQVRDQAFIGLGAVLRNGVSIAERSFIGAGAVVLKDTESDAVYAGNPARKMQRTAMEVSGGN